MNVFNQCLDDMMNDIFTQLDISTIELSGLRKHWDNSKYSRMHICRAWRNNVGTLCVQYDDGLIFKYVQ